MSWFAGFWRSHRLVAFVLGALIVAAAAVALIWPITDLIATHDVGPVRGVKRTADLQAAREAARTQMLTLGAGLFAAGALVYTALNFTLSREAQVTDRYTKAIEQLGSGTLDVRIGAIYALERIARDSPKDHPVVMEVLAAFVRENSRHPWPRPEDRLPDDPSRSTRPDVQAALTVIGRRNTAHDRGVIDLTGANLTFADLHDARLARASLGKATLHFTMLIGADLTRAFLVSADLTGASLRKAKLTNAHLNFAQLDAGLLEAADLTGVDLRYAQYPMNAEVPQGWVRDANGKLDRAASVPAQEPSRPESGGWHGVMGPPDP
jgi:Pentapeptide repeats (8 copies)